MGKIFGGFEEEQSGAWLVGHVWLVLKSQLLAVAHACRARRFGSCCQSSKPQAAEPLSQCPTSGNSRDIQLQGSSSLLFDIRLLLSHKVHNGLQSIAQHECDTISPTVPPPTTELEQSSLGHNEPTGDIGNCLSTHKDHNQRNTRMADFTEEIASLNQHDDRFEEMRTPPRPCQRPTD